MVSSLLFIAASKMYRTPSMADTPLPDCVVSNHVVCRARIMARHAIINSEYSRCISEVWGVVRKTSLKHQALINTRRLEDEWAVTPYKLSREAIFLLYQSILSDVNASTWIFIGRVFVVPTYNRVLISLETPDANVSHVQPTNPRVTYVY